MGKRRPAPADAPSTFKAPGYARDERTKRDAEDREWAARSGPVTVRKIPDSEK